VSAVAVVQSNAAPVVDAIYDNIRLSLQAGTGSSFESLKAHARVGQGLIDLKEHLRPRNFGREVEGRFGLKKQWRARLMKLADRWGDVLAAIELAKTTGQMTRSEYSVDGALALIAARHRQETDGADDGASDNGAVPKSSRRAAKPIDLLRLLLLTLTELARAHAHIRVLESEIERLSGSRTVSFPAIGSSPRNENQ
jgi:hypothetical protein